MILIYIEGIEHDIDLHYSAFGFIVEALVKFG